MSLWWTICKSSRYHAKGLSWIFFLVGYSAVLPRKCAQGDESPLESSKGWHCCWRSLRCLLSPWSAVKDCHHTIVDRPGESQYFNLWHVREEYTDAAFQAWPNDGSPLLDGTAHPFEAAALDLTDPITSRLLAPDGTDDVTVQVLQLLCTAYAQYVSRMPEDHFARWEIE